MPTPDPQEANRFTATLLTITSMIAEVPAGSPRRRLRTVLNEINAAHGGWGTSKGVSAAVRVANLRDLSKLPEGDPEGYAARALNILIEQEGYA